MKGERRCNRRAMRRAAGRAAVPSTYRYGLLNRWAKRVLAIERERRAWSATYVLLFEGNWWSMFLRDILLQSPSNRR